MHKSIAQTNVVSAKSFSPNKSSTYIIGNEGGIIEKNSIEIKRSTYCPNLTRSVLNNLASHKNAKKLYLLGVKYIDKKGGDIQAGDSTSLFVSISYDITLSKPSALNLVLIYVLLVQDLLEPS